MILWFLPLGNPSCLLRLWTLSERHYLFYEGFALFSHRKGFQRQNCLHSRVRHHCSQYEPMFGMKYKLYFFIPLPWLYGKILMTETGYQLLGGNPKLHTSTHTHIGSCRERLTWQKPQALQKVSEAKPWSGRSHKLLWTPANIPWKNLRASFHLLSQTWTPVNSKTRT